MEAFIPPRQGLGLLTSRWAAFGLFAAGLSFSGCSCDEPIGKLNGQLGLDPEMLDFGDVPVGAEKELPLKLTNKGSYLLTIKSYSATMPFIGPTGTTTLSPSEMCIRDSRAPWRTRGDAPPLSRSFRDRSSARSSGRDGRCCWLRGASAHRADP